MEQWDYIVVGAGSAGAAVANRLSANPANQVLLLEAGGSDKGLQFDMVVLATFRLRGKPDTDWMYVTEKDPSRCDRFERQTRGRVLGGSSSLNGTVYVRGNRGDYDHWAQLGNTGWDYDSMLKVFNRMEDGCGVLAKSQLYGHSGPIKISESRGCHPLTRNFMAAMNELGVRTVEDYNYEQQVGVGITRVNQCRGKRWGTGRGYLAPIVNRKNLKIVTNAMVHRVIIEDRKATGVEFEWNDHLQTARCRGEVILSGGVFNTPKLLMLSGIGDPEHLTEHGISVVHANHHVGLNLHDHASAHVKALVRTRTTNMENTPLRRLKLGIQYKLLGSGAATHHWPAVAFVKLRPDSTYPDLQYHFGAFIAEAGPDGMVFPHYPGVTVLANVTRPRSRGYVRLKSADPLDAPIIQPNLLGDSHDVETLIAGIRFGRRLLATTAFANEFIGEHFPGVEKQSDAELEVHLRRAAATTYHSCGTAKMGIDEAAVVDPRLRVTGIKGLRVADSSIIPQIPSGNTNAISIAIGEKASDLIMEDARGFS